MQVSFPTPTPTPTRLLEQNLVDLHRCKNLSHAKQVHAQILKANLHQHRAVATKLIAAFSNCRQIGLALSVFNQFQEPDVLLYNTLIRALIHNSQPSQAFAAFFEMQSFGMFADNFTYPFLLKACSGKLWLSMVEMIHAHIVKFGFCSDIFVPNSLIDCYSKCGSLGISAAMKLFRSMGERDVVSWNSMIGGLVQAGQLREARSLFDEMSKRDSVSWNTMLDGYAKAGEMDVAFELFENMPRRTVVSWSTMVSGYSKAGDMDMARMLFDKMPEKTLVAWTIIICGYAEKGLAEEAISLYDQMEHVGLKLDDGAIISILAACAQSGLLDLGKKVHASIKRIKFRCCTQASNALVDMYTKCGSLATASSVFEGMHKKDVMSWNTMLQGLAIHGHAEKTLQLLSRMKQEGYEPNGSTFTALLCACIHAGFLEEGLRYFSAMERDFEIVPQVEHYSYMIDLLGRGGRLQDAYRLVHSMPMKPNAIIWGTLLGVCRMHNDVELAEEVLDHLAKLENSDSCSNSTMSNISTASGDGDGFANVRLQVKSRENQIPLRAISVEIDDEVRECTASGRSQSRSERLHLLVDRFCRNLKRVN